jgi:flagellar biosynthesis/type III secretory pathway chaperone
MTFDKAILSILKEQISVYKILHELLKRERESLINFDAESVEEISKEKDTVVMRLRLLEEERIRLIERFAENNNLSPNINLEMMAKLTGDNTFSVLRSEMLSLLQSIDDMNKFNSILIDRSIRYIRTTSNFFNSFTTQHMPRTTGVLLSKET